MNLILRWFINAIALLAATHVVAGFHVDTLYAALIAALVLGFLNAVLRPLLLLLTLPFTIVTLGLFTFVINACMVWFMSSFIKGVTVEGFWAAFMVALFLWAVSTLTGAIIHSSNEQAPR